MLLHVDAAVLHCRSMNGRERQIGQHWLAELVAIRMDRKDASDIARHTVHWKNESPRRHCFSPGDEIYLRSIYPLLSSALVYRSGHLREQRLDCAFASQFEFSALLQE